MSLPFSDAPSVNLMMSSNVIRAVQRYSN